MILNWLYTNLLNISETNLLAQLYFIMFVTPAVWPFINVMISLKRLHNSSNVFLL